MIKKPGGGRDGLRCHLYNPGRKGAHKNMKSKMGRERT